MNCFYCGKKLSPVIKDRNGNGRVKDDTVTRDHLTPKSRGGGARGGNKVNCCASCNFDKANLTLEEYRVVIAYRRKLLISTRALLQFPGEKK